MPSTSKWLLQGYNSHLERTSSAMIGIFEDSWGHPSYHIYYSPDDKSYFLKAHSTMTNHSRSKKKKKLVYQTDVTSDSKFHLGCTAGVDATDWWCYNHPDLFIKLEILREGLCVLRFVWICAKRRMEISVWLGVRVTSVNIVGACSCPDSKSNSSKTSGKEWEEVMGWCLEWCVRYPHFVTLDQNIWQQVWHRTDSWLLNVKSMSLLIMGIFLIIASYSELSRTSKYSRSTYYTIYVRMR